MKPKKLLNAEELWTYALKCVGARAQSAGEIQAKLRRRSANGSDVEATLEKLKEYGFLDDKRYAENFASARLENEGFGKQRALRDLAMRRVPGAVAAQAVEEIYTGKDETQLIEQYIRRRYRNVDREKLFQQDKELASAFRRLRLAGFQSTNILRVLKQFAAHPEKLDEVEMSGGADEME